MQNNLQNQFIRIVLFINLVILFLFYIDSLKKSFWFDEIFSVGMSEIILNFSFNEISKLFANTPGFQYLLGIFRKLFSNNILNFEKNIEHLRFINLMGLIPLTYSFFLLKKKFKKIDLKLLIIFSISNYYFIYYILELRTYFLLFCFSFFLYSFSFIDFKNKFEVIFLATISLLIGWIHIFGFLILFSIFIVKIYFLKLEKKPREIYIYCFILLISSTVTLFYLYHSLIINDGLKLVGWLKFEKWYYREFLEWTLPIGLSIILIILVNIKYIVNKDYINSIFFKKNFLMCIIPPIILLLITNIISLKIPVITHRNLIVIVPAGIILLNFLFVEFKKNKINNYLLFIILIFTSIINYKVYAKNASYPGENIKWVIENSFNKECHNIPIFINSPSSKSHNLIMNTSAEIYSIYKRPIFTLSTINENILDEIKKQKLKCDIFFINYHSRKFEENLNLKLQNKINYILIYAPKTGKKNYSKSGAIAKIIE